MPVQSLTGIVLPVLSAYSLEKAPETGRWRFMDVSPKFEAQLAAAAREELIQEFGRKALPANHPLTIHVRRVVSRILEANNLGTLKSSGKPSAFREPDDVWDPDGAFGSSRTEQVNPGAGGREWELMVVNDDKMVNAMAAFGDIVVFTGILPVAKDEQGLAAILGHEIAHVVARHSSERISSSKIMLAAVSVLAMVGLDLGLSNMLSQLLLELPNGRRQEFEADQIGLRLMAKACYDPQAAPDVFSRLAQLEAKMGHGPDFLQTHPASKRRVERLKELLPMAYQVQAESPECARIRDNLAAFQDTWNNGVPDREQPVVIWRYA
ncbi:hypothetical protein NM688_g1791 [Phlebia brevispora]|uniref:Uncharacterized protein n=1 Tax=Phlebia brevispora TaxID=194682 RepID=A0ACC1TAR3_9APHY|nr:hypothetical protein NM688_g1791 [Phlebia brevispora]